MRPDDMTNDGVVSLRAVDGQIGNLTSFERDVLQRISRTVTSVNGRHEPTNMSNGSLA